MKVPLCEIKKHLQGTNSNRKETRLCIYIALKVVSVTFSQIFFLSGQRWVLFWHHRLWPVTGAGFLLDGTLAGSCLLLAALLTYETTPLGQECINRLF